MDNYQPNGANAVLVDVTVVRKELLDHAADAAAICAINPWRPIFDIAFDWGVIVLACTLGFRQGVFGYLFALCVVGNRQRALGNLLHEASHRNLHRAQRLNDWLAEIFLAPALATDLGLYRASHSLHHAKLGIPGQDPDYVVPGSSGRGAWKQTYWLELTLRANWPRVVLGHFGDRRLTPHRRLWIAIWWAGAIMLCALYKGFVFSLFFVGVWIAAKATVFHAITVFRELCDHFGLERGGIYSFTRDTCIGRCWRWIIHPHNNGYHLTHHLMPSVPYYRLPTAQRVLSRLPSYAAGAVVCNAYIYGRNAVVRERAKMAGASN